MMDISDFIAASQGHKVIDVRSPAEFAQAHIPNAVNVPLFDNQERAEIGTLYKQSGRESAVVRGIEIAGPRFASIIRDVKRICGDECFLHCWRGGMRSGSVAWLLQQAGMETHVLDGGYKSFRKHVLASFQLPLRLNVLSGLTGAGKTELLPDLAGMGQQVLDLEGLASHRGSAFGGIGLNDQPTVEQFENLIFNELSRFDPAEPIWVEDESRNVGRCNIPAGLFDQMRLSHVIFLDVSRQRRAKLIERVYGDMPAEELLGAIRRVTKRLGGQRTKQCIDLVQAGDIRGAIDILLDYYDSSYLNAAATRDQRRSIRVPVGDDEPGASIASRAIEAADSALLSARSADL